MMSIATFVLAFVTRADSRPESARGCARPGYRSDREIPIPNNPIRCYVGCSGYARWGYADHLGVDAGSPLKLDGTDASGRIMQFKKSLGLSYRGPSRVRGAAVALGIVRPYDMDNRFQLFDRDPAHSVSENIDSLHKVRSLEEVLRCSY
jgi:hypothetical protein